MHYESYTDLLIPPMIFLPGLCDGPGNDSDWQTSSVPPALAPLCPPIFTASISLSPSLLSSLPFHPSWEGKTRLSVISACLTAESWGSYLIPLLCDSVDPPGVASFRLMDLVITKVLLVQKKKNSSLSWGWDLCPSSLLDISTHGYWQVSISPSKGTLQPLSLTPYSAFPLCYLFHWVWPPPICQSPKSDKCSRFLAFFFTPLLEPAIRESF